MMTIDEAFDIFWAAWPRRVARKDAFKAFVRAIRGGVSLDELLEGIDRYKAGKPDWQDFAHAATWLNGERWTDEWEAAPRLSPRQQADIANTVKLHRDDPIFHAIGRLRGSMPPSNADGEWWFPADEVARAKEMAN